MNHENPERGADTTGGPLPPYRPSMEAALRARAARSAAGIAIERPDPITKAARNPTSLRAAITGKCWDCQGGDADPNPRRRIRECPSPRCPLHPVRPYQRAPRHEPEDPQPNEE